MTTSTETALARQVREEQEAHNAGGSPPGDVDFENGDDPDPEDGAPLVDEATGQTAIVDRSQYEREDLQIPKVDGQSIDQIVLKGNLLIRLNRSEASDVAVYNELKLGREVELVVVAKCISSGATGATNKDGDLDVVVGIKGLKVHSLRKPAGADWVKDAA